MYIKGICSICGKEITEFEQCRQQKKQICHSKCLTNIEKTNINNKQKEEK